MSLKSAYAATAANSAARHAENRREAARALVNAARAFVAALDDVARAADARIDDADSARLDEAKAAARACRTTLVRAASSGDL